MSAFRRGIVSALVVGVLVLGGVAILGQSVQQPSVCKPPEGWSAPASSTTVSTQAEPATLSVPEGTVTTFSLGVDLNSGPRSIPFRLDKPISGSRIVQVSAGPFGRSEDGAQLPSGQLMSWAQLDSSGTSGFVTVCLTPKGREQGPWGTFAGSVQFEDPRIAATPVNLTLSASYPKREVVFLVWVAVCVVASGYVFFLRDGSSSRANSNEAVLRPRFEFLARYWTYMTGALGVITVAAGLLAATAVFSTQYLAGTAWSASVREWLTFCGAVGAAFVAGGTAGRLAGNVYAPPAPPPPGPGGAAQPGAAQPGAAVPGGGARPGGGA